MYIVIDSRDVVATGYKAGFEREGLACTTFAGRDFADWLTTLSDEDVSAIQAVILGETEERMTIPMLIRARGKTPLIALKEERGLDETLTLFNTGVDDVVKKPAPVKELIARSNAIWRRSTESRQEANFGRLVVYFDLRDPTIDGEPIELPRRERQILEYLARNRRRRITKSQLFNAIYGLFNESVDETVIEGHISKLRKKLRQQLGYDVIDAKRFAGYSFIGDRAPCEILPDQSPRAKRPSLSIVTTDDGDVIPSLPTARHLQSHNNFDRRP
ncbi:response regulator transcription factor [Acuticoccus sp. MNP-M23]|uniref:response regulator transcription factor n=1 Tax=Acuticoccus sp. MNP-M23 TaxID=3072793 RepID=UPI002815AA78|nr:response regulator transcription factor [Acuticoccus sp. MNP-M23]WMS41775.1 response regulator transcription factor [Acuticoccus sp. MNP-M23]